MSVRAILPGNPGHHAVQIYKDDETLCEAIADFLADGLAASQPTLVIATPVHCDRIVRELGARRFNVAALVSSGSVLMLDADELMDVIVTNGRPDATRFKEVIGVAMDRVAQSDGEQVVRVYGELVDVLWRKGDVEAALTIERLWNDLLKKYSFSLLCGYAMKAFFTHPAHRQVCACHTHVHHAATANSVEGTS